MIDKSLSPVCSNCLHLGILDPDHCKCIFTDLLECQRKSFLAHFDNKFDESFCLSGAKVFTGGCIFSPGHTTLKMASHCRALYFRIVFKEGCQFWRCTIP